MAEFYSTFIFPFCNVYNSLEKACLNKQKKNSFKRGTDLTI